MGDLGVNLTQTRRLGVLARNCVIFSFLTHFLCAWFVNWVYHPDELFQILEFGGYKLGVIPAGHLAWEFPARIRPAIQPALVFLIGRLCGTPFNPILTALILRIIASITGWLSLTFITLIGVSWLKDYDSRRLLLYGYACLWFLPYIHANFSSESISGSLFFAGLGCIWMAHKLTPKVRGETAKEPMESNNKRKEMFWLLGAGFLLGLAFVSRFQSGLLMAGLMFWSIFIQRFSFKKIAYILIPAAMAVTIGIILDRWFYGEWVNTAWNYLKVNIFEGKANSFGVSPWWSYFTWSFENMFFPLGALLIPGFLYAIYKFPKNIIVISIIPFLVIHFIIGHKEPRFLFPLADAVPIMFAMSFSHLKMVFEKRKPIMSTVLGILVAINIICIGVLILRPQNEPYNIYEVVHDKYWNTNVCMFCSNDQPYFSDGLNIYYYRPANFKYYTCLKKKNLDSLMSHTSIGSQSILLFFDREKDELAFTRIHPEAKLIYSEIPPWMYQVNINNWISRTIKLSLYEIPVKDGSISDLQ